jgi:RHS repeat-associated protein
LVPEPPLTGNPNLLGGLKLVDLNKDGKLDLLVSDITNDSLLTFLGDGSGLFQTIFSTASVDEGTEIQAADVNRDGFVDVIVATQRSGSTVLMGAGDGTYVSQFYASEGSSGMAIADINNDTGVDLITASDASSVALSLNGRSDRLVQRSYTYDAVFNQLTSMTDELGRKTLFEIDSLKGHILSMTRVKGLLDSVSGETDDVVSRYTYLDSGLVDTMTDGLGRIVDYDYNAIGRLTKVVYAKGTLDEAIEEYEYDLAGNQAAMIDANGNRTAYEYDAMNRVKKVTEADPDGVGLLTSPVMEYEYDAAGNQIQVKDARNFVTEMTYDQRGRLVQVIQPDPDGVGALGRSTTTIEYDRAGNQSAIVDALGHRSEYRYDQRNRLIEIVNPDTTTAQITYDLDDHVTGVRDENNHRSRSEYDTRGRLIRSFDALNFATIYTYDDADQLTAVEDANGHITQYRYDDLGRRFEVTDARGKSTQMVYDKVGNLKSVTDPLTHANTFFYDNLNRLVRREDALNEPTSYTYDKVGNQLSVTDALNRTTAFTYDRLNRLVSTKDALDQTSSVTYDSMDNVVSSTDELSHTTTYSYDGWNRLVTVTDPLLHSVNRRYDAVGNLAAVTNALGRTTSYGYDVRDRRIKITDAEGGISRMTYDNVGNLKSVTDPVLKVMTYDYNDRDERVKETDTLGHARSYTYDKVGNLATLTDGMLHPKTYEYDELDRLITQTDARGGITRMTYDDVSNLKSVTDSVLNVTSYDYNQRDELISETNTLGKSRTFTYDQVGNLATKTDRNNRTTKFEYDRLDRLKNEQWKDAANSTVRTFTYDYDAASRLTSAIDPDSSYTYSYDQADRLTQSSNAGTAGVPTVLLDYDYDAANYLVSTKDTIAGQVRGTTALTRDRLNRVIQIQQSGVGVANKRVDMNYDAASQLKGMKRYTDLAGTQLVAATEYNYDLAGRLENLTHRKANNATIANYGLTYDAADRLTQITSIDGPSVFDYDVTDQLTSADHATQTDENYGYDLNGNRTNAGNQTGGNNQLLTDGTYNYAYDDEGNRISRTRIATGAVTEYVWDYRNRLTRVVEKNVGVVVRSSDYKYDVFDRRIAKTVDLDGGGTQVATTERYVYDGDHIALVFDGQGNQMQRFLYGIQVDQVLVQENANGDLLWALSDHQGSVRDVVDGQGNVLNHIFYDSFGNVRSETNAGTDFRFGYTGRELDGETGLYYYRARYYDAQTGQFIGQDPLSFGATDTNLYRYVFNSSTNLTDPSGKIPPLIILGGLAIGALAPVAANMMFPEPAQTPTRKGDYHPDTPDRAAKEAVAEVVLTGGAAAGKKAIQEVGEYGVKETVKRGGKFIANNASPEQIAKALSEGKDIVYKFKHDLGEGLLSIKSRCKGSVAEFFTKKKPASLAQADKLSVKVSGEVAENELRGVGQSILDNPVTARGLTQVQDMNSSIILNFKDRPLGKMAQIRKEMDGSVKIELFTKHHKSNQEIVETFAHESSHARRMKTGLFQETRYEEYTAFKREFLAREGKRPSFADRQDLWVAANMQYSHLPIGKTPNFLGGGR